MRDDTGTGKGDIDAPFSLRLTFEERTLLEQEAGDMPLGAYIRSKALSGGKQRQRRRYRKPVRDEQALAELFAQLGNSRIANNLNQLAKAVNTGSLPVTPDTENAIRNACADVEWMRKTLLRVLGFGGG